MVFQDDLTGEYALYIDISIREIIDNIRRAVNELSKEIWRAVTVDKISEYSVLLKSWSHKREGTETTLRIWPMQK